MEYIKSESYLCLSTLLEMVLRDIGIEIFSRFDIAQELGITLPLKARGLVEGANYSDNETEIGIKIDDERINVFFDRNKVQLHAKYIQATPYTIIEDLISEWRNSYIIFLYSYGTLVRNQELLDVGHAALFVDLHKNEEVCIYDPGPKDCGIKLVNCHLLEDAMNLRRGGCLLLCKE